MGGVRNRDAKRASAKVFSSGGGGGTKGPAVVDKRGQEVTCPHCDKVYKQANRLQEHIKKQHAEAAPGEEPTTAATAAPAARPAPAAPAPLMDVGSKGGYYAGKSPKLLLHEWCLKEKLPKPRYKAVPAAAPGRWRCRVVLPHPRQAEADAIMFLAEEAAAETEEEALQRGAVVGLHRLAGDRSLHSLLPEQYRGLWKELGHKAEESKARAVAAAARKERAAAREKAAVARAARHAPSAVIMTDQHRRAVADLLADLSVRDGEGGRPGIEAGPVPEGSSVASEARRLGFSEAAVAAAMQVLGPAVSLMQALDWLCLNIPEEELPTRFAPGAAGKAPEVLNRGNGWTSAAEAEAIALEDPAVAELIDCGYPLPEVMRAVAEGSGAVEAARRLLFAMLTAGNKGLTESATDLPPRSDDCSNMWEEEVATIQSIFGEEDVTIGPDSLDLRLSLDIDQEAPGPSSLHLTVWTGDAAPRYPFQAPVLSVRCAALPPGATLALTRALHARALGLLGQPMVFELAQAVQALVPEALVAPLPFPPAAAAGADGGDAHGASPAPRRSDARPARPRPAHRPAAPNPARVREESVALQRALAQWRSDARHAGMRAVRAALPAAAQREAVLEGLAGAAVLVVEGATGCGKSTQVPQFLLEDAVARGAGGALDVVVTQPRRISAVGLAARVAAERGEAAGEVVGHAVKLDSKRSARTRLLFCTTGILLRRLLNDPGLEGTTHVILDEVHERSLESDLLLLLLKKLLQSGRNPDLKVVLMSATADADLFAAYFEEALGQPTARVVIPGFTHPVTEYYLEDALEQTRFRVTRPPSRGSSRDGPGGKKEVKDKAAPVPRGLEEYSEQTRAGLAAIDEATINYELIGSVVEHVITTEFSKGPAQAILIFASGAEEIDKVVRQLRSSRQPLHVLPLHGGLPPAQQSAVFQRPPKGCIKVVVATNVAETSITIDDVVCVIDTGRVKEMAFDPDQGLNRLAETWVSQASAQQRRGRAGRVRPGTCWRLFSRATWRKLEKNTAPEIHRVSLQGFVLDIKGILGSSADVEAAARAMLTPPRPAALEHAMDMLLDIGALETVAGPDGRDDHAAPLVLTPLGRHLTAMPCDPAIGKLLIFGALLCCLDPVLTMAAALAHGRPMFLSAHAIREEADAARRRLTASVAGSQSDHLALIAAYNAWRAAGGPGARAAFARDNFLSQQGMEGVLAGRRQLAGILQALGFVDGGYLARLDAPPSSDPPHALDTAAASARVVKAALAAGLYPNLLRVDAPPPKFQRVHGGTAQIDADPAELRFHDRSRGRVFLHPSSCNFGAGRFPSGWLVYSDIVRTSKVFVRASSAVPAYAILLFAGELSVDHVAGTLTAGGWARFKAPARIGVLVRDLRAAVASLLAAKIADPGLSLAGSPVVEALHSLLASDGF
ncbi:hypothetical protein ACKKBF_B32175 [Auxenochlorella protothecoides x Auxenochlorella symbiontica]